MTGKDTKEQAALAVDVTFAVLDRVGGRRYRPAYRQELEQRVADQLAALMADAEAWARARSNLPGDLFDERRIGEGAAPRGEAGDHVIRVWACECGNRWRSGSGFPPRCADCKRQMEALEIPVRSLPDAFSHIDSVLADVKAFITKRLVSEIEQSRQAAVGLSDVGGFRENAELALRWAAEAAGYDYDSGRVQFDGDGWGGYVRWFADDAGTPL